MELLKQAVGIDIAKDSFVAVLASGQRVQKNVFCPSKAFPNTKKGFNQLLRWLKPMLQPQVPLVFLMESTGVYYQKLAHHLHHIGKTVHVVLPNTSSHFGKSLNLKSKTDSIDARMLAQFALERSHKVWTPPSQLYGQLRNLTRYQLQLQQHKTVLNNMHHSKTAAHQVQAFILQSNKQLIAQIDRQIARCRQQIQTLIASEAQLNQKVTQLATIKGLGRASVAVILAETNGFEGFNNQRQLVSYAGYDVVQRQSGTSIAGKTRISKKGNSYIRNALHFPAMVACRFNPTLKATYQRISQHKPSKMIAQVAIQRKLLLLMFSLHKHGTTYQLEYKKVASAKAAEATLDQLSYETELS